jgi:hypothetical protein
MYGIGDFDVLPGAKQKLVGKVQYGCGYTTSVHMPMRAPINDFNQVNLTIAALALRLCEARESIMPTARLAERSFLGANALSYAVLSRPITFRQG